MARQRLEERYRQFAALMDRGAAAVEEEDVDALEAVSRESSLLLGEIQSAWQDVEAEVRAAAPAEGTASLAALAPLMRLALERVQENHARIAAWKDLTQASLCAAVKGGAAVTGYGGATAGHEGFVSATV